MSALTARALMNPKPALADVQVFAVRALTQADIVAHTDLEGQVDMPQAEPLQRLKARHHALARLIAAGKTPQEACIITGHAVQTYYQIMHKDQSFRELVAFYSDELNHEYLGFHAQLAGVGEAAIDELRTRIEEDPERIATPVLLDIVTKMADRTGHGPSSSTKTEVNVTVGLADKMRAARERARAASIEATARDVTPRDAAE